nr:transposase, MuDR, MULE transposase domain protein [Tanacetum cinerariifolium]
MINDGTVTHIETDNEDRFKIVFIAFGVVIWSFKNHMRPLIIIDAAHLKGTYLGTNLLAVGMDGNNQIIPIATGVSQGETGPSWTWHLMMNCKLKSIRLQCLFWKMCKAYSPEDFNMVFLGFGFAYLLTRRSISDDSLRRYVLFFKRRLPASDSDRLRNMEFTREILDYAAFWLLSGHSRKMVLNKLLRTISLQALFSNNNGKMLEALNQRVTEQSSRSLDIHVVSFNNNAIRTETAKKTYGCL